MKKKKQVQRSHSAVKAKAQTDSAKTKYKKNKSDKAMANRALADLKSLRQLIDEQDKIIIEALVARLGIVRQISNLKKQSKISKRDPNREEQLLINYQRWAKGILSDKMLIKVRTMVLSLLNELG